MGKMRGGNVESLRRGLLKVGHKAYLFLDYVKFLAHEPSDKTFEYKCMKYKRCRSFRRSAYCTERAVEIPIVMGEISSGMRVLEVGNVLHGHCDVRHDVIDKYEKSPGVLNCDIVDYKRDEKYDIVVSISTLEHVGFDECVKDADKCLQAVKSMKSLIKPDGKIIITVPLGYNLCLDHHISKGRIPCSELTVMHRVGKYEWVQEGFIRNKKYTFGKPFEYGNYIAIMVFGGINENSTRVSKVLP